MKKLHISDSLDLPLRFLELRSVTFGGSGSGKTAGGRVVFEESIVAGVVAGAIDLKSDWWGLKSTADGKSKGIPVVIFGGEHQDVPLDEAGGSALADVIADLRQPFVVDLEHLSKTKQLRFLAAFFERLYDVNREPLVLFCDEADRYAPQKPMSPEANICLGAVEDIAKRGRKHGIYPKFIVQRNASLNKNVSELCDVATVYRTPGPRDQEAVKDWFSTNATAEQRDAVMDALSGMQTGTAVICSAHPSLKIFTTVALREPWTFDSSATPEIGKRTIQPKELAQPDLEQLRVRMASTIEKAKDADPKELRKKNADLQKRIAELERGVKLAVEHDRQDYPTQHAYDKVCEALNKTKEQNAALKDAHREITSRLDRIGKLFARLFKVSEEIAGDLLKDAPKLPEIPTLTPERVRVVPAPARDMPQRPRPVPQPTNNSRDHGDKSVGVGGLRRILVALAQRPQGLSQQQLGVRASLSSRSGTFSTYLGKARANGWIEGREHLRITEAGLAALGDYDPLPSGMALLDHWIGELGSSGAARMLRALADVYPKSLTNAELGEAAGISAQSGTFSTYLGKLRSLELVTGRGELTASEEFFS